MTPSPPEVSGRIVPEALGTRWPSVQVMKAYASAHADFVTRFVAARAGGLTPTNARIHAFSESCEVCLQLAQTPRAVESSHWSAVFRSVGLGERVQSVASVLAILTHAHPRPLRTGRIMNGRRPHNPYGTYPNSPALCRDLARLVVQRLLSQPNTKSALMSVRSGKRTGPPPFKILELSFEAGQLFAAVALEILRQSGVPLNRPSNEARAILDLLAKRCLWGFDRNPLAAIAARCVFNLISLAVAGRRLPLRQLHTGNSLLHIEDAAHSDFDAVINNPPWGERLRGQDRVWIRRHFQTTRSHPDTYIAFMELGVRLLRPGGVFGFVVPSQFVAARNAAGLRTFLVQQTRLEHLILLPRTEFSDATVRAAVVLGRRVPAYATDRCKITFHSFRYHLTYRGPARSHHVMNHRLTSRGTSAWWPILTTESCGLPTGRTCELKSVARLTSGIKLSDLGQNKSSASKGFRAVRGRDFGCLTTLVAQSAPMFYGSSARVAHHRSIAGVPRVFVRELVGRDGQMCATVASAGVFPLHGVLTVTCDGIKPNVIAALLNSRVIAEINRQSLGGISKVDFQRITLEELGELPVARELCAGSKIAARVDALARRAIQSKTTRSRSNLVRAIDSLLDQLYRRKRPP